MLEWAGTLWSGEGGRGGNEGVRNNGIFHTSEQEMGGTVSGEGAGSHRDPGAIVLGSQ